MWWSKSRYNYSSKWSFKVCFTSKQIKYSFSLFISPVQISQFDELQTAWRHQCQADIKGNSSSFKISMFIKSIASIAFSNEALAKARFLNLGSNPNLTKTKLLGLDLKPIRLIQVGSDPGIFSQLVSSFMYVTKFRV